MGKFFVFRRIKPKFCSWLYKKRFHTSWKFQLNKTSNTKVIAKKPLTNLYEMNSSRWCHIWMFWWMFVCRSTQLHFELRSVIAWLWKGSKRKSAQHLLETRGRRPCLMRGWPEKLSPGYPSIVDAIPLMKTLCIPHQITTQENKRVALQHSVSTETNVYLW